MEYYSVTKETEIMSLAATWMDIEMVKLSEDIRQKKTNTMWCHLCMESESDINELIYKTETKSQT